MLYGWGFGDSGACWGVSIHEVVWTNLYLVLQTERNTNIKIWSTFHCLVLHYSIRVIVWITIWASFVMVHECVHTNSNILFLHARLYSSVGTFLIQFECLIWYIETLGFVSNFCINFVVFVVWLASCTVPG